MRNSLLTVLRITDRANVTSAVYHRRNISNKTKQRKSLWEVRWPSSRASDSRARGLRFDPHSGRRVVSLTRYIYLPKSTGNTQEAVAPSPQD